MLAVVAFMVAAVHGIDLHNKRAHYYGIHSIVQINSSCLALSSAPGVGGWFLRGRLSGPEVALISWNGPVGCWRITTASVYFLEIVVLASRQLDTNFTLQCMESGHHNRITAHNATITATTTHSAVGAWRGSRRLFTRFQ